MSFIDKMNHFIIKGFILFCLVSFIFLSIFGDYTDNDFSKAKYLHRAEDEVSTIFVDWQRENWRSRGFTDESQFIKTVPEFQVTIKHLQDEHSGAEYIGNATFKVGIGTDTILKSINVNTITVHEGFIVNIKTNYTHNYIYRLIFGDEWQLVSVQPYHMNPNMEELNEIIQSWSKSKK